MDTKEEQIMENISMLTSSREFIDAAKAQDIEKMKEILEKKPRSVNSIDTKDKNWTALHYACHYGNWDMLKFL